MSTHADPNDLKDFRGQTDEPQLYGDPEAVREASTVSVAGLEAAAATPTPARVGRTARAFRALPGLLASTPPYATPDDVAQEAPQLVAFDATTRPTYDQVEEFCALCTEEMNSGLTGRGYTLPIISVDDAATVQLNHVCTMGALARTLASRAYGVGNPEDQGFKWAWTEYSGWLRLVSDPNSNFHLPGVEDPETEPPGGGVSGPLSVAAQGDPANRIRRDMVL